MFNAFCCNRQSRFFSFPNIFIVILTFLVLPVYGKYTKIFEQQQINLSFDVTQPVLIADLLPQAGKELVIVGIDDKLQRILAIYYFDTKAQAYKQQDKIIISNNVFGYDIGKVQQNGLQHLYLLEKSAVKRYVPAHLPEESPWVKSESVASMYVAETAELFKPIDFIQDLNNDGADDIILPHFEQLNLWLSDCCGARVSQSLPIAARFEMNQSSVSFFDQELYFEDMDQDGKTDLVHVEIGQLSVYLQNNKMQFTTKPSIIEINQNIHPVQWWAMKAPNGQEMDQSNIQHRSVDYIDDLNGDDIPDIAVQYTNSFGVLDKNIIFEFYYGELVDGYLRYPQQANTSITSDDTLSDLVLFDRDMDGKQEVSVSSFDIGISQIVGAILSSSIDQDVLIFSMDENNQFAKKPQVKQEVEITFSLSSGTRGQPLVKMLDINGDNIKDIVYSDDDNVIRVSLATPNQKRLYAKRSLRQKLAMPKNPFNAATDDLNDDGKADIVLHHGPADSPDLLSEVLVLLAN